MSGLIILNPSNGTYVRMLQSAIPFPIVTAKGKELSDRIGTDQIIPYKVSIMFNPYYV